MITNKVGAWSRSGTKAKPSVAPNDFNLEKRVRFLREERIRHLQKDVVEISLQNNSKKDICSILAEIKKLRAALKYTQGESHC